MVADGFEVMTPDPSTCFPQKLRQIAMSVPGRWLALVSLLAVMSFNSYGDTLVFQNGDRLTGTALPANPGEIHFESDVLGAIVVSAERAVLVADEPPALPNESDAGKIRSETAQPRELSIAEDHSGNQATFERAPLSDWSRQLEFGVTDQSGRRDMRDVAVRVDLTRSTKTGEMRLQGRYLYGRSNDETSTDKLGGALRVRRGLTPDLFAQMETRYERDSISEIDHAGEQSIGMGTNLLRRDGLSLSVGGGAAARFRDSASVDDGWSYLVDAFQEFKYSLNQQVTLSQNLSVVMSPFQEEVLAIKLNAALSSALTETLKLVMRYEFEYDQSLVPDARKNQRLVTSFGYLF